jgi:uncharacterized membrane protein YkvA (DUF1232 family)
MNDLHARCLDAFPEWLRTLPSDAAEVAQVFASEELPNSARRVIAGALTYLFKSLDLIPDGIEDLGFLDDAFVLRVAASIAVAETPSLRQSSPALGRLAKDSDLVAGLLDKDYGRLVAYVKTLPRLSARGRSVDDICADESVRNAFLADVTGWAQSYQTPSFARDEKTLVKLHAFLGTKLPA